MRGAACDADSRVDAELLDQDGVRNCIPFSISIVPGFPFKEAFSGAAAPSGTTRWHGIRARRERPWRRYRPELRGHRLFHRRWPRHRCADFARINPGQQGCDRGGRQQFARRRDGRDAVADREPCHTGLRLGRTKANHSGRHYFRRGTFLHQPVGQGRACLRRRYRRLQLLCSSAATFPWWKMSAKAAWH